MFYLEKNFRETCGHLLIEVPKGLASLNQICVYAKLICSAKNYNPIFISRENIEQLKVDEIKKYFSNPNIYLKPPNSIFLNLKVSVFTCFYYANLYFNKKFKLIKLNIGGFYIGDIVYDQYLAREQLSTVNIKSIGFIKILYRIIQEIYSSKNILALLKPHAIFMSHRVGLQTAPMIEVAEKLNIPIYSYGGMRFGTLIKSSMRHCYEYRATIEGMEKILGLQDSALEECLIAVHQSLLSGQINTDAALAFSKKTYAKRQDFSSQYGLDDDKKNIFVMLHAFTDYPHSHFEGMLFDDFYDWFIKTLNYAASDNSVNWIFKMHPASHYYPVKNINWDDLMGRYQSKNLVFIRPEDDFNARSIESIGDAIITCLGTAGFEFSALARVPSVTAGDNPYAEAGFAIYPKSQEEYFQVLGGLKNLERLESAKWKLAKATFIFIHRLSRVDMSIFPALSQDEFLRYQSELGYSTIIFENYKKNRQLIEHQFEKYIKIIGDEKFNALRTDPVEWMKDNFDAHS